MQRLPPAPCPGRCGASPPCPAPRRRSRHRAARRQRVAEAHQIDNGVGARGCRSERERTMKIGLSGCATNARPPTARREPHDEPEQQDDPDVACHLSDMLGRLDGTLRDYDVRRRRAATSPARPDTPAGPRDRPGRRRRALTTAARSPLLARALRRRSGSRPRSACGCSVPRRDPLELRASLRTKTSTERSPRAIA